MVLTGLQKVRRSKSGYFPVPDDRTARGDDDRPERGEALVTSPHPRLVRVSRTSSVFRLQASSEGVVGIPKSDNPVEGLRQALLRIVSGWRKFGVINIHHVGLKIGLEDGQTGNTYLTQILEPTLQAIEGLLGALQERGSLGPHCTRLGALSLLSPIILGLLHQDGLGGKALRPMVIEDLIDSLVQGYCLQHATPSFRPEPASL